MSTMQGDLRIQRLLEALKAAAYYIERLELVQQRRKVRDMTEAMEHYHREALPLIAAYENPITTDRIALGPHPDQPNHKDNE